MQLSGVRLLRSSFGECELSIHYKLEARNGERAQRGNSWYFMGIISNLLSFRINGGQ